MASQDGAEKHLFRILPNNYAVVLLAFIGGFVDAAGYVRLSGLFTSSITGNLVVACIGVDRSPQQSLTRFLVSLSFFTAACITSMLAIRLKYTSDFSIHMRSICTFLAEIFMFLVTMITGIAMEQSGYKVESLGLNSWVVILLGCLLGAAMGAHNAAAQEVIDNCPSTTVMTMTLVKNAMHAARTINYYLASKLLVPMKGSSKNPSGAEYQPYMEDQFHKNFNKLSVAIRPLFSFLLGAVIGALLMDSAGFAALCLPIVIISGLIADINYGRVAPRTKDTNQSFPSVQLQQREEEEKRREEKKIEDQHEMDEVESPMTVKM